MNNKITCRWLHGFHHRKGLIASKLTAILFLLNIFTLSANTYSQEAYLTIQMKNASIQQVLDEISNQSEYTFAWSSKFVDLSKKVNIAVKHKPINRVLDALFSKEGVQYKIIDKKVVLSPAAGKVMKSQQKGKVIQGTVKSSDGGTLPGVNVYIKETKQGTTTDMNGHYYIRVQKGSTLVFSYIGMQTIEVVVENQSTLNVILKSNVAQLKDVVVIGYGTAKKHDFTGSVSSIQGDKLTEISAVSPIANLQGKVSGVQIVSNGLPGSAPMVLIRGVGSIQAGITPLYVVDGVITDDIRNLNPDDIVSINVLKDASSQAIYGARGSNGVIMITTKSGHAGKLKVNYSGYTGFNTIASRVKMAGSKLYEEYTNEALQYDHKQPAFPTIDATYNTDWLSEITRPGKVMQHTVTMSGGSKDIVYFISLGYYNEQGILKKNNYRRISLKIKNEYYLTKFLKFGNNINLSSYHSDNPNTGYFNEAYRQAPDFPVKDDQGIWGWSNNINNVGNPVASLEYWNNQGKGYRGLGSFWLEAKIIKGLTFRSNFGLDISVNNGLNYSPFFIASPTQQNLISNLSVSNNNEFHYTWDNYFTYNRSFKGVHNLKIVAGITTEQFQTSYLSGYRQDVPPQENYWYLNLGNAASATNGNGGDKWRRMSYFSRVSYNYKGKYLFTGTLRREGSSRFGADNRWGVFPAFGLGWRISEENFLKGSDVVSNLKLRGSWGIVGNDNISTNAFLYTINTGINYVLNQNIVVGSTITDIKDPSLKWETSNSYDIGLDFGFFKNRLSGSVDYYNKQTKNLLFPLPLPAILGSASYVTNVARMENKGFEFNVNWSQKVNDNFSYSVGGNVTFNQNKVLDLANGLPINGGGLNNGQYTTRTAVGEPVGSFYVYKTNGIYQNQDDINNSAHFPGAKPGDLIYVDTNGDGILNDDDRVFAGSYQPKFYFGFNFSAKYKQFDFLVTAFGNLGNKVYNGKKAQRWGGENIEASLSDYWTTDNPSNTTPRASNSVPIASDYYIESGDFLRINNLTVGYSIPVKSKTISKFRIYLSAQNPVTFKKFSGFNPELPGGVLGSGIELNPIPTTAKYLFGVNLNL